MTPERSGGVAIDQPLTIIVVTISPGIAGCFQTVLLATQNNSMRSLTLSAAASAGMLSFKRCRITRDADLSASPRPKPHDPDAAWRHVFFNGGKATFRRHVFSTLIDDRHTFHRLPSTRSLS
jgi:hypothetical protein